MRSYYCLLYQTGPDNPTLIHMGPLHALRCWRHRDVFMTTCTRPRYHLHMHCLHMHCNVHVQQHTLKGYPYITAFAVT